MFAVCCAVKVSAEFKDRILRLSQDYADSMGIGLVFVDDMSHAYTEPSELGYNTDSVSAPFAGKTPYECSVLLNQMCQASEPSDFDDHSFAIIDERSLKDDTVLLVQEPKELNGGEESSVRVVFEMVESQLLLWIAGKTTLDENRESVQNTEDGVLRPGMDI